MKNKLLLGLALGAFLVAPSVTFAQSVKVVWKDLGQAERNQILAKWKSLPGDKKVPWIEFRDNYVETMPAETLKQFEDEAKDRLAREAEQEKRIAEQRAEAEKQAKIDAAKAEKEAEEAAKKAEIEAKKAQAEAEKEAAKKAKEEKTEAAPVPVETKEEPVKEVNPAEEVPEATPAEEAVEPEGMSGEAKPVETPAPEEAGQAQTTDDGKLKSVFKKFF